jgi:hypothetical protein
MALQGSPQINSEERRAMYSSSSAQRLVFVLQTRNSTPGPPTARQTLTPHAFQGSLMLNIKLLTQLGEFQARKIGSQDTHLPGPGSAQSNYSSSLMAPSTGCEVTTLRTFESLKIHQQRASKSRDARKFLAMAMTRQPKHEVFRCWMGCTDNATRSESSSYAANAHANAAKEASRETSYAHAHPMTSESEEERGSFESPRKLKFLIDF